MKEGNRNDAVGRTRTDVKFLLVLKRGNAAAEVVRGESSSLPKAAHTPTLMTDRTMPLPTRILFGAGGFGGKMRIPPREFSQKNFLPCLGLGVPLPFYKWPHAQGLGLRPCLYGIHFETSQKGMMIIVS